MIKCPPFALRSSGHGVEGSADFSPQRVVAEWSWKECAVLWVMRTESQRSSELRRCDAVGGDEGSVFFWRQRESDNETPAEREHRSNQEGVRYKLQ